MHPTEPVTIAWIGAHFLEKAYGGRGVLLGGVPGVAPGEVVITAEVGGATASATVKISQAAVR